MCLYECAKDSMDTGGPRIQTFNELLSLYRLVWTLAKPWNDVSTKKPNLFNPWKWMNPQKNSNIPTISSHSTDNAGSFSIKHIITNCTPCTIHKNLYSAFVWGPIRTYKSDRIGLGWKRIKNKNILISNIYYNNFFLKFINYLRKQDMKTDNSICGGDGMSDEGNTKRYCLRLISEEFWYKFI